MALAQLALVTCSDLPNLTEDDVLLVPALKSWGLDPDIVAWDDPNVDWESYDAAIVRSTWDYTSRRDEFVEWTKRVPNLVNSAASLEWNTDKHYLKDLADRDIPIVPTTWLVPADNLDGQRIHTRLPAIGRWVIKPTISAGSKDTASYNVNSAPDRAQAIMHCRKLVEQGKTVMIQPYLRRIDEEGETCLIFIEGRLSHVVRKEAMLTSPDERFSGARRQEKITPCAATAEQVDLAEQVLAAAADRLGLTTSKEGADFLFARVDLVPGDDGEDKVIEFEIVEPSLFLKESDEGPAKLANAIARRAIVQAHRSSQGL